MDVSTIPEEADPSKGIASSQDDALSNRGYETTREREAHDHLIVDLAGDAIALIDEAEWRRALIEHSRDGIAIFDHEHRLIEANPKFAEMLGYTPDELIGLHSWDVDAEATEADIRAGFADPLSINTLIQTRHRRKDGSLYDAEVSIQGAHIRGRDVFVTSTRDISEQKRAEQALVEAKLAAEAATAAKSDFLAHMSHELRTPLNAVIGLTQVLEQANLPLEQRSLVQRIRLAGQAMLQISNDILDLAKIEANQLAIASRPCTLSGLLQRLESLQDEAARAKGLALEITPAPALSGQVLTDPLRLEQILANLVSNAIKFTDRGAVRVWTELLSVSESNARLRFVVRDTGIGIASPALEQLFTPFIQADSSITRRFGGTGLGLSISKRLVELMGGAIGVESCEGQGSTFWFELTLERVASGVLDVPETAQAPCPRGQRLVGLTVLAVDDNALNLEVITRLLALEGANATPARHGREALEQLRAHPWRFDAVLMDVQMPVMDGLSATRAIRRDLKRSALPVIALSAGVLREEQQRAREAGCNDFLAKPVELEHLVERLLRWVGARISGSAPWKHEPDATARSESCSPLTGPVPGIDPERLVQLTQGDPAFTRRLLCRFLADIDDIPRLVRADLAQGAYASAAARLHGLRGAAVNLGALELARHAGALEEAVKAHGPTDDSVLDGHSTRFTACFERLHRALVAHLNTAESRPADVTSAATVDRTKLGKLRAALATNRPQPARRLFAELERHLMAVHGEQTTQALAMALDGLRFAEALQLLDETADL